MNFHSVLPARRRPAVAIWTLALRLLWPAVGLALPAGTPLSLREGLTYVRLEHLPQDAAGLKSAWTAPALIVDLRYPTGAATGAPDSGLPDRSRADPLFVLVGPDTPPAWIDGLRRLDPALITLGIEATHPRPDVPVKVTPEHDRQAYDAFTAAASIETLFTEKNTNQRFDEAVLAREHAEGLEGNQLGPPPPPEHPPAAKKTPPPLIDSVLRRAVQLDRALLALGRISPG